MSAAGSPRLTSWDAVEVGDELNPVELKLTATTMVLQVSGGQDWAPLHHDQDYAVASGHPDGIFYNTSWTQGLLSRILTDWAGTAGWVSHLDFQMRQMNRPGDVVRCRARVAGKSQSPEDGRHRIQFDVWLENDRLGVTTPGHAEVIAGIPSLDGWGNE